MRIIMCEAGVEYRVASAKMIKTPQDAANAAKELANGDTECFAVLVLNTKNGLKAAEIVTTGLLDSTLIHPREIFRPALLRNGASIVLVHNHPSGDPTPSAEDLRITRQLVDAGRILGVPVLDHVVLGHGGGFISLRESGMVSFTA